jgi:hypothetical protein
MRIRSPAGDLAYGERHTGDTGGKRSELLKDLLDVLGEKSVRLKVFADLEKQFSIFVEETVLKGGLLPEQEFLLEAISSPAAELNLYLDKIFAVERVNRQVLRLFLKLFPSDMEVFYLKLDQRMQDTEFLASVIESVCQASSPLAINILEYVYKGANELVKIESLEGMRRIGKVDTDFLMRQLDTDSFSLRSKLISVLILDSKIRKDVLGLLFDIPGLMGSKNGLLIENMQIACDLHFTEAAESLKGLSRRRFFWNRKLRAKALQILKEWNVS